MFSFNSVSPAIMYIDINSCFASVEQMYNPALVDKPVGVAAYLTDRGCILAASYEAKKFGVKTGMRVFEAKKLCPNITVLECDPPKYRKVHHQLKNLLGSYTENVVVRSIDEFVMDLKGYPAERIGMIETAKEIKSRIKKEIGENLTVSIGISTNRYLAKVASDYQKPDGLTVIDQNNYEKIFQSLKLTDLCGIKRRTAVRLFPVGIKTPMEMYLASIQKLKSAFKSICGYYWFMRLHGFEVDNVENERKSFGNQHVLSKPMNKNDALPILQKLIEKMGKRLRDKSYTTRGIHLALWYSDHSFFHHGENLCNSIFSSKDIYQKIKFLFDNFPDKQIREISVGCFNLSKTKNIQEELFCNIDREIKLSSVIDKINNKYGDWTLSPARILLCRNAVADRIAFGKG
jgi:DNA polymerase IV